MTTNTEGKTVDVLDVMASAASLLRDMHPRDNSPTGNDLREARAAVAELIDAHKAGEVTHSRPPLTIAQEQMIACNEMSPPPEMLAVTFRGDAARRLRAALARVGGA